MNDNQPDTSAEIFQEGVVPVQAFSSPVVPPGQETDIRQRLGRPARVVHAKPGDTPEARGKPQTKPSAD